MHKLLIVSGLLFAASGCKNPNYCAGNPDNNCNEHPADGKQVDGMEALDCNVMGCGDSGKVCDTTTHACVECTVTESAACTGTSPVCKNDACTACVANPDCPSHACEPSGACAASGEVAWVAFGGTGDCLSEATPCASVTAALGTGRSVVRVTGKLTEAIAVGLSQSVTIIGDRDANGAITSGLSYAGTGAIVTATGAANITLVDMELDGLNVATYGIASTSTGTIELDHVTIHNATDYGVYATAGTLAMHRGYIHDNKKAGIDLFSTTFAIDNSFIVVNGTLSSLSLGGVSLSQSHGTLNFSTIANNAGNTAGVRGVSCSNVGSTFTSDIVYGNSVGQAGGDCIWTYSDFDTVTGPAPSGGTNLTVTPSFVDGDNGNFHLATGSLLRDMGDPTSTLPIDVDGNARPQGNARDIGADELMP